ncbi:MAG: ComEC/Rec2 family competence protein [Candidatus Bathycorpusculaceae bacterium]
MKSWFSFALLALLAVVLCYAFFTAEKLDSDFGNQSVLKVYFFDVGQGDSIFIDTDGLDVLVDGGPRSAGATLTGYLEGLNVSKIDVVVASHPHEDRIGGLVTVLNSSIVVNKVLHNGQGAGTAVYRDFISLADGKLELAERGMMLVLSANVNFTVLNPTQPLEFTDVNSNSIVLRLQAGKVVFLLSGDATFDVEESMLNAGLNVSSQVLKVAHHGSRYATSQSFLDAVNPTYAVISAGIGNPYGHSHNETVQRLLDKGVIVYGTYHSGTIVMSTDGETVQVHGNPEPIPEMPKGTALCITLVLTILVSTLKRKSLFE